MILDSLKTTPTALKALTVIALLMVAVAFYLALVVAPREVIMGDVQRLFYFHVGSAWASFVGFTVTVIFGIAYLIRKDWRWDRLAASSVEVGLLFAVMTLLSGMVWARPVWNAWWTWDPRLTTFAILILTYAAYLLLRQGFEDLGKRATFSAVYGIVAFCSVPITFFATRLLRTIHPVVMVGAAATGNTSDSSFNVDPIMQITVIFSTVTLIVLYATLLWYRYRLAERSDQLHTLKSQTLTA